ncbi:MAG: outer membrane protein assembly factor BamD, partial [Deltaproteobacteria bacterium]|nr:outer membrane protein assembly factor BamD [Deltaproteobacteria bacterium]
MLVKHFGIVPLLALALLAGCAYKELNKQKAETLDLQRAKDFQKAGRYDLAIEKFEAIKNKYPLSPEAIEAELEIAESYYLQGSYVESLAYFQSF